MEKKKPLKQYATPQRINEIETEIRELDNMLRGKNPADVIGASSHFASRIDKTDVLREIGKKKKELKDFTPEPISGQEANKINAWCKQAEGWIKDRMPTRKELDRKEKDSTNFEEAVRKQLEWMKKGDQVVNAYRHYMRRLDPSNPTLTNIERFRRLG